MIGAPIDCIGADPRALTPFGTELAPTALRSLGVIERVRAVDHGDLDLRVVGRDRDTKTGTVGGASVASTVAGARPGVGLVYLDGHLDLYDHVTSPTGEAADMPTAAALGIGEPRLLAAMDAPVITPDHLSIVGPRDPDEPPAVGHLVEELGLAVVEPTEVTADPAEVAMRAVDWAGAGGAFWVHLDVDVFDQAEFPATDYLMPGGLTLETGRQRLSTLARDERLLGASVGCYNPEKDPDGSIDRQLVELLGVVADGRQRWNTVTHLTCGNEADPLSVPTGGTLALSRFRLLDKHYVVLDPDQKRAGSWSVRQVISHTAHYSPMTLEDRECTTSLEA